MSPKRTKTKAEQEEAADAAAKYNKDDKGKQKQDAKAQQAGPPAAATKAPRPLSGEWTGLRVVPDDDAPLPDASSGSRKRKTRQEEGAAAGSDSAPQGHCLPPPFFRPQEHATLTRALLKAHLPDLFLTGPALGGSAEKKEAEVKELTAEYLRVSAAGYPKWWCRESAG